MSFSGGKLDQCMQFLREGYMWAILSRKEEVNQRSAVPLIAFCLC